MKTLELIKILATGFLLFATIAGLSQPGLWNGVSDDDWGNYQNWASGTVPNNTVDVTIPAGCTNYPKIDKILVIGSTFVSGDKFRCKSLDIQVGGQVISADSLEVNGVMNIAGLYLYDEDYFSGTHVVNSGGSITVTALGSLFIGQYGYIPDLKQDLIVYSGGSVTTAGYFNVNDCLIIHSGASFNMTGGTAYALGYEGAYNSTYPASFYVASGASGGVSGGEFYLQGKEVSGYYALTINDPAFDFTGTSHVYLYIQADQGAPYPDFSVYMVDGVAFNDVTVTNEGSVTTIASNMQVDNNFTVNTPSCLTLVAGKTLNVLSDFLLKSDLILGNNFYSSLIDYGQINVSGTSQVQWSVQGNRWHLIASPVAGETANIFSGMHMMEYSESSGWSWVTSLSTPLSVMKGFSLYFIATWWQTVYFDGTINTGTIGSSNNLTMTTSGWNLVSNPYPSAIDWDASSGWTKTNVNNAIYLENNGNWASYVNGVGTNGGTRYIAPCHGFFVQANAHPGTLIMNNSVREHKKPIYMKNTTNNFIRLQASTVDTNIVTRTDEAIIRIDGNATTGFDGDYDAYKFTASDSLIPQIYTSGDNLSINTIPAPSTVMLKFSTGNPASYKISATETGNFNYITLKDLFTGAETDLATSDYTFSYNTGDNEERFMIFLTPTEIEEGKDSPNEKVMIFSSENQIHIFLSQEIVSINSEHNPQACIYDMSGRLIKNCTLQHTGRTILTIDGKGVFLVSINTGENIYSKKVHIH